VDLGIIHPYAVAGSDGEGLLVSGRALRAEHHLHLRDTKGRRRAVAARAPRRGQVGSRRWRKTRRRQRVREGQHRRRVRQAQHEAAKTVVGWAVQRQIGTLVLGDPRGVLEKPAGRRHNRRVRTWAPARLIRILSDKATQAGITVALVDERGSSSTCPGCRKRVPKPAGRVLSCPHCGFTGHRDLSAAATIATRMPGGGTTTPTVPGVVTHRRAGRHLPGVVSARRDPRRRPPVTAAGSVGRPPARPTTSHPGGAGESLATRRGSTTNPPPGKR
jgi:IS605 OrfB family transposase